jgi:hypothetical protein
VTLSERLEQAKRQRLLAAGLLQGEPALKPEAELDVTDRATDSRSLDLSVEVQSTRLHSVSSSEHRARSADTQVLVDSARADCPNCRRAGRVDMVDLIGHGVHMSCPTCGTLWRVPRAD